MGTTYFIPKHVRDPREKLTMCLSNSVTSSPSQRSGMKEWGSGNTAGLLLAT